MIQEEDRIKMSFSLAADIAKQLIALSTAIITLCVALADKLFSSQAIKSNSVLLLIALVLFVLSILSGLLCMMAITGTLGKPKTDLDKKEENTAEQTTPPQQQKATVQDPNKGTIYQSNISLFMKTQMFMFLAGVVLSVVFLFFAACLHAEQDVLPNTEEQRTNTIQVKRTSNYTFIDSVKVDTLSLDADIKE